MRISESLLSCVVFIGEVTHEDSSGRVHGDVLATGFIVHAAHMVFPGYVHPYLVTARHVANDFTNKEMCIFLNIKGGGVRAYRIVPKPVLWKFHPSDASVDLAVGPICLPPESEMKGAHVNDFLTEANLKDHRIGIGDEVYMVGLFTPAPGTQRNQPIVRAGNIAMFPSERIQTSLGFADVYLVEARSIGGISGSPAFVRETLNIPVNRGRKEPDNFEGLGRGFLLGVVHGHWDIKESEMNEPRFVNDPRRGVNMGIAIVTPATKILDIINTPELVAEREKAAERDRKAMASAKDSTGSEDSDFP